MAKTFTENYRYERKFSITDLSFDQVIRVVVANPEMFTELYPPRYINNIYFESPFFKSFYETVDGISNREKFRLRWYGNMRPQSTASPQLEIKIRRGLLNTKKTFHFENVDFSGLNTRSIQSQIMTHEDLPKAVREQMVGKVPLLINRYKRNYFISADKRFRLTVDREIQYLSGQRPEVFIDNSVFHNEQIVLEIKYTVPDDLTASRISTHFPFRLTRNSKYTNGVDTLFAHNLI